MLVACENLTGANYHFVQEYAAAVSWNTVSASVRLYIPNQWVTHHWFGIQIAAESGL
jgi:hypothetical protein